MWQTRLQFQFTRRGNNGLQSLRKALLLTACLLASGAPHGASAQKEGVPPASAPPVIAPMQGYVFPQHQTLTFTVDWRVFTAGRAVFQLDQQGPLVKVQASADTVGATNMIYQVMDKFQSSFNPLTGCSAGFSKQTQEGRRKISSDLVFTPGATAPPLAATPQLGTQSLNERNLVKNTVRQVQGQIPACVIDSLSGIFYVGSQALTVGQDFKLPLADAMRTVAVTMKVEARETVKTPAGTFSAIRVQPTADAGVVKNRGTITIWYSDDARHLPVQIRAKLLWGTITFHLQSVL
jgi:hypothetical protein